MSLPRPQDVHDFWFDAPPFRNRPKLWWQGSPKTDQRIEANFKTTVRAAIQQKLDGWSEAAQSCLSLILLLDQFTRNIYRGTPAAFSGDALALRYCQLALKQNWESTLHPLETAFLLMPLEHSEELSNQKLAVERFTALLERTDQTHHSVIRSNLDFARQHLDIIERFGRFPHRNQSLDRESTTEEIAYLESGGKRFGQ